MQIFLYITSHDRSCALRPQRDTAVAFVRERIHLFFHDVRIFTDAPRKDIRRLHNRRAGSPGNRRRKKPPGQLPQPSARYKYQAAGCPASPLKPYIEVELTPRPHRYLLFPACHQSCSIVRWFSISLLSSSLKWRRIPFMSVMSSWILITFSWASLIMLSALSSASLIRSSASFLAFIL